MDNDYYFYFIRIKNHLYVVLIINDYIEKLERLSYQNETSSFFNFLHNKVNQMPTFALFLKYERIDMRKSIIIIGR